MMQATMTTEDMNTTQDDKFEADIRSIMEYLQESGLDMVLDPEQSHAKVDLDVLRNWKAMFGRIYGSKVTDDPEFYIWRPLLRTEYRQMIGTPSETGTVKWDDKFLRQDAILKACLLYPKPTYQRMRAMRAGVPETLEEQILYQSGFIPLEAAVSRIQVIG